MRPVVAVLASKPWLRHTRRKDDVLSFNRESLYSLALTKDEERAKRRKRKEEIITAGVD